MADTLPEFDPDKPFTKASSAEALPEFDPNKPFTEAHPPSRPTILGEGVRGIGSGLLSTASGLIESPGGNLPSALEMMIPGAGIPRAAATAFGSKAFEQSDENIRKAREFAESHLQSGVPSLQDIHSASDAVHYGVHKIGQAVPAIAQAIYAPETLLPTFIASGAGTGAREAYEKTGGNLPATGVGAAIGAGEGALVPPFLRGTGRGLVRGAAEGALGFGALSAAETPLAHVPQIVAGQQPLSSIVPSPWEVAEGAAGGVLTGGVFGAHAGLHERPGATAKGKGTTAETGPAPEGSPPVGAVVGFRMPGASGEPETFTVRGYEDNGKITVVETPTGESRRMFSADLKGGLISTAEPPPETERAPPARQEGKPRDQADLDAIPPPDFIAQVDAAASERRHALLNAAEAKRPGELPDLNLRGLDQAARHDKAGHAALDRGDTETAGAEFRIAERLRAKYGAAETSVSPEEVLGAQRAQAEADARRSVPNILGQEAPPAPRAGEQFTQEQLDAAAAARENRPIPNILGQEAPPHQLIGFTEAEAAAAPQRPVPNILGREAPAISRDAEHFTPEQLAAARTSAAAPATEILGQQAPPRSNEPPAFTQEQLDAAAVQRRQEAEQRNRQAQASFAQQLGETTAAPATATPAAPRRPARPAPEPTATPEPVAAPVAESSRLPAEPPVAKGIPEPQVSQAAAPAAAQTGPFRRIKDTTAYIPTTGASIPVTLGVIDVRDLTTSHHDDGTVNGVYSPNLQPRKGTNREPQINYILNGDPHDPDARFRPELMGESPDASNGTPLVGEDTQVESGNGRTIAIRRAYERGLPQAEEYRQYLAAQGYPIEGIERPILVRINRAGMDMPQREQLARTLNVGAQATMSATDRAMADAQQIPADLLRLYNGGDMFSAANRPFWQAVLERIAQPHELPALSNKEQGLSPAGQLRLRQAMLAKAYGDPETIARLIEDPDSNIKAIGGALTDAAPRWAQFREAVADGRVPQEYDLTAPLLEATRLIMHARNTGRNVAEFMRQDALFGDNVSPETEGVMSWMLGAPEWTRRIGRDKMRDALVDYAENAQKSPGMLEGRSSPLELTEQARERAQESPKLPGLTAPVGKRSGAATVRPKPGQDRTEAQGQRPDQAGLEPPESGPRAGEQGLDLGEKKPPEQGRLTEGTPDRQLVTPARSTLDEAGAFREASAHPDDLAGAHAAARDYVLAEGQRTGNEYFVSVDPQARFLEAGTSDKADAISFNVGQLWDEGHPIVAIHHNHPANTAVSREDLTTLAAPGLASVTAHAHNGAVSSAALTPRTRASLEGLSREQAEAALEGLVRLADRSIAAQLAPMTKRGMLSESRANQIIADASGRLLDAAGFLHYVSTSPQPAWLRPYMSRALAAFDPGVTHGQRAGVPDRSAGPVLGSDRAMATISGAHADTAAGSQSSPISGRAGPGRLDEGRPGGRSVSGSDAGITREARPGLLQEGRPAPAAPERREIAPAGKDYADAITREGSTEGVGEGAGGTYARAGEQPTPDRRGRIASWFNAVQMNVTSPLGWARKSYLSAEKFNAEQERSRAIEVARNGYREMLPTFLSAKPGELAKIWQVREWRRLKSEAGPTDGRGSVVVNDGSVRTQLSKAGDRVYLETPREIAIDRELTQTFQKTWSDIIAATSERFGWHGTPTPAEIMAAADKAGSSGDRRRLTQLAGLVTMLEEQRRQGYQPLMRYGDYKFAVTPAAGIVNEARVLADTRRAAEQERLGTTRGLSEAEDKAIHNKAWKETIDKYKLDATARMSEWDGNGFPPVAWFELMNSRTPTQWALGGRYREGDILPEPKRRLAELEKQFPKDRYDIEHGFMFAKENALRDINITAVEKLLSLVGNDVRTQMSRSRKGHGGGEIDSDLDKKVQAYYKEIGDQLIREYFEQSKAGFKRRSYNTPGYDQDFSRGTATYLSWIVHHLADLKHGEKIDEINDKIIGSPSTHTKGSTDPQERIFWDQWNRRNDRAYTAFDEGIRKMRSAAFYWALGGNVATTFKILTHGPLLGVPVMGTGLGANGRAMAAAAYVNAMRQAVTAIRADTTHGLTLDWRNIRGLSAPERAMLERMESEGSIHHQGADELRAINNSGNDAFTPQAQFNRRVLNIWASNVSAADRMIRIGMALAAHRTASRPGMLEKFQRTWGTDPGPRGNKPGDMRGDEMFTELVKKGGLTPETVARFMVDRTAGVYGEANRSAFMRSRWGAAVGQFRNYELNYLSAMTQQMKRLGPEGKVTAGLMLAGLGAFGGLGALPFFQDLEHGGAAAYKMLTGIDPDIDTLLHDTLPDALGMDGSAAEIMLHGFSRDYLGIDLGQGIGFGDLISRQVESGMNLAGPAASILGGGAYRAWQRSSSGQEPSAWFSELMPNAIKNIVQSYGVWPAQGVASAATGKVVVAPEQVTPFMQGVHAFGFQPGRNSQGYELEQMVQHRRTTDQHMRQAVEARIGNLETRAIHAERNGDARAAADLRQQASEEYQRAVGAGVPMPKAAKLAQIERQRIKGNLYPEAREIRAMPKQHRAEFLRHRDALLPADQQ